MRDFLLYCWVVLAAIGFPLLGMILQAGAIMLVLRLFGIV